MLWFPCVICIFPVKMTYKSIFPVIFLVSTFLMDCIGQVADPFPPGPSPDRIVLTWNGDPATTQSVTWRTNTLIKHAWAEIAIADPGPDFQEKVDLVKATTTFLATNHNVANFHSVTFTNLQPNTMYIYRVGDGEFYSEWFQFKTAEADEAPFSFLYFGDAQNDLKSMWSRCIRQAFMTMPDVDFLLHAGDLVNRANNDGEWGEWFYAGAWIYGMKPSIATPGNHEYYRLPDDSRNISTHWKPTFTLPENGPEGLEESVYYLDYQNTRIISLNSTASLANPEVMKIQKNWLIEVLKNNPNRWTIVTQHHPIYSTALGRDNEELRDIFQPIFEKYNVDLILQGHDHTYGRGHNASFGGGKKGLGPTYVVSVSGPKMYNLNFGDWMERGASNTQLYQLVKVDGEVLRYEAYTVLGELYDVFELRKKSKNIAEFVDLITPEMKEILDLPQRQLKKMTDAEIEKYRERMEAYKASKERE